jgi:DNA-binding NarL/FixJ family response regulator
MKILLADDHALIRSGLRNELSELDAAVQFLEAWDAESIRQTLDLHAVDLDLALIDLTMPGMDGARTIADLRQRYPMVPLIVISGADPVTDAQAALRAGAAGFIPKAAMSKVMLQAIRLVLAGGRYLPPEMMRSIEGETQLPSSATAPSQEKRWSQRNRLGMLSERQREVFALLAKGLSNKMIARELKITEGTVKTHVATIFDVFHVHNRVSAVTEGRRLFGDDDRAD